MSTCSSALREECLGQQLGQARAVMYHLRQRLVITRTTGRSQRGVSAHRETKMVDPLKLVASFPKVCAICSGVENNVLTDVVGANPRPPPPTKSPCTCIRRHSWPPSKYLPIPNCTSQDTKMLNPSTRCELNRSQLRHGGRT